VGKERSVARPDNPVLFTETIETRGGMKENETPAIVINWWH
jgi:hypothetical protein